MQNAVICTQCDCDYKNKNINPFKFLNILRFKSIAELLFCRKMMPDSCCHFYMKREDLGVSLNCIIKE